MTNKEAGIVNYFLQIFIIIVNFLSSTICNKEGIVNKPAIICWGLMVDGVEVNEAQDFLKSNT